MPLEIGTRVTVYWSDDDEWYKGTVAALEPDDDTFLLIEYDDGTIDSIDTTSTKFRSSSKPNKFLKHDTKALMKQRERIATLNIGSRISIWWPAEKEYYTGTLTQILEEEGDNNNSPNDNRPHHITYDNGDEGWLNLIHRKFKPVEPKVGRLQVGSRVAVYDDDKKRNCLCTVTKIKLKRVRPHQVMYDDERKGKEWINLNVQPFLDIGPRPACTVVNPTAPVNANTLKKRKTQFLKPQLPDDTRESKRTKIKVEKSEETSPSKCQEICGICKSLAKRPRAMSCHHIFCKRCIKDKDQKGEGMCPLCEFPINQSTLFKFDPEHVSFRAVEALEPTTTQVLKTFSSASAASLESPHLIPSYIIKACQSKRRDDRAYNGYFWRFQGSKDRILRVGESIKDGIPIEQLDPETLVVINVFPSSRKANEGTKVSRCAIRRVLERRGTSTAGGFFWRLQGETHGPWPDPEPTNLNPVEQLDFETGDVLNSYISLAEAKRAMGMRQNSACIREVCDGIGRATAQGYFWRWNGSKSLPNHMMGVQKIVQIRKTKGGSVVKEFRTSREAEAYFQHRFTWSHVCRCCREKGYFNGYYWQYRMLRESKSTDEQVIGKRLRVQPPGDTEGEWLEGKINSFDPATGRHEIIYDTGTIEYHALEEIHYEWKNDQGQKPVEKLDLRSGQILVTFDSISDAAASIGLSETPTQIVAVLKGKTRSCYGFFWRYKGSDALPRKSKAKRKVEQLCLKTGGVLGTFDSIAEAGKAIGISTPGISYCCNGRNSSKSAGGFGWRFRTVEE